MPSLRLGLWGLACVAWCAAPLAAGDAVGFGISLADLATLMLVLEFGRRIASTRRARRATTLGAAVALVGMVAMSATQLALPDTLWRPISTVFETIPGLYGLDPRAFPGRASGWTFHPNVWGGVAALATIAVITRPWVTLPIGAVSGLSGLVVVMASGSRSALVALGIGTALALLTHRGMTRTLRRRALLASAVAFAVAAGAWFVVSPFAWRWDPSSLIGTGKAEATSNLPNLLRSSEDVVADTASWHRVGVDVRSASAGPVRIVRLVKSAASPEARVYQAVTLAPNGTYTVAVELRAGAIDQRHGIAGWGRIDGDAEQSTLNLAHRGEGRWAATAAEDIEILHWEVIALHDGWQRATATFRYMGVEPLVWRVGPTVDQRRSAGSIGTELEVRRLQLVTGVAAPGYSPTHIRSRQRSDTVSALADRVVIYRVAWAGIVDRPWLGWWHTPDEPPAGAATPHLGTTHAHNLLLDTLYRRGIVGLLALGLVIALGAAAAAAARGPGLALVATLALLNTVDTIFWTLGMVHATGLWLVWSADETRNAGLKPLASGPPRARTPHATSPRSPA